MQGEGGVCKNGSKSYSDETAMRVRTQHAMQATHAILCGLK